MSQNFNKIHVKIIKNMFMQNPWASMCKIGMKKKLIKKLYIYNFYINDVSFLLMMS